MQDLIAVHTGHELGPYELELEILRAVALRVHDGLGARGLGGLTVRLLVLAGKAAQDGRDADALRDARLQERARVGLEGLRLDLHQVDLRAAVLHLAVLVEPTVDILAEARALAGGRRR